MIKHLNYEKLSGKKPTFVVPPFYTMEMMKLSKDFEVAGNDVYHLEAGQPFAPTPKPVLEEASRILQKDSLSYCPALGYAPLREAIAQHYRFVYELEINPERVIITPGSSLGLYIALLANFEKGAKIAVPTPSYPCYRNLIGLLGLTFVEIPTKQEENYLLDQELLENLNIDGLLIASPNNPTGSMYDENSLKRLASYCQQKKIKIIVDEIYHCITYEQEAKTALNYNNDAVVVNGFSKYFAMPGWRLGWLIVPEYRINDYKNLLQNMILCSSSLTQIAAVKAFSAYEELDEHVFNYKRNRDILFDALKKSGIKKIYKPQGAFYIYVELEQLEFNCMEFCKTLLQEEGVAVAPGIDFDANSKCSIRLSYSQNQEVVEKGAEILCNFLKRFL